MTAAAPWEEGWKVEWWGRGRAAGFLDPRGHVHLDGGWRDRGWSNGARGDGRREAGEHEAGERRAPEIPPDPVAALVRRNRRRGAVPDPYTASARWRRERDIPDEILFRATEAVL